MFFLFEFFFIAILIFIFYTLFKNERSVLKSLLPKAHSRESWSGSDRRKFRRFPHELTITYMILKRSVSKSDRGRTIDVSEGGIKVILDKKLDPGTSLDMKIVIPITGETAEVVGEVMWTEDADDTKDDLGRRLFYSGIRFSFIKEPAGRPIVNYIRSLSSKHEG